MSHRLVAQLADVLSGSAHVRDAGLATAADSEVWAYAAANGFVLVSKDTDFQQRALLYGHPPKVIWVRAGNGPTKAVETRGRRGVRGGPDASFLALS